MAGGTIKLLAAVADYKDYGVGDIGANMSVSRTAILRAARLAFCLAALCCFCVPGLAQARSRDNDTQASMGLGSVSKSARQWLENYYLPLPALGAPFEVYPDADAQQRAEQVFDLINAERAEEGLSPLKRNAHLDAVAQAHAVHMQREDFFEHECPLGMEVFERIDAAGAPRWSWAGENIAAGYKTPQIAVDEWMDSKGHRENIENGEYEETGIGVIYAPHGEYKWYWVQVFATFRDGHRHRGSSQEVASSWLDPQGAAPAASLASAGIAASRQ
jgi:uncharacterized protein YkwD